MQSIAIWAAPIATTIAALMTASTLGSRITGWGFGVFTIGSIGWIIVGLTTHQPNIVWQNAILTALNLFGIWRWLGRQVKLEEGGQRAAEDSERRPGERLFPVSLLTKAKLQGANGAELGAAVDAMATADHGHLVYVVISSGGVGGVGEIVRRLPWQEARIDGECFTTPLGQAAFEGLEQLAKDDWR
ncbi:MAG: PRC-barrel domain-containing protein [Sphingomicrobium sp.]